MVELEVPTLLFPATKQELSEARLTERIGMSPAGVWNGCEEKFLGAIEVEREMTGRLTSS